MFYEENLKDHKVDNIKMFLECKKFDDQGEIKSTEQIIASVDLKNTTKAIMNVN
jgi:hypothetical protein